MENRQYYDHDKNLIVPVKNTTGFESQDDIDYLDVASCSLCDSHQKLRRRYDGPVRYWAKKKVERYFRWSLKSKQTKLALFAFICLVLCSRGYSESVTWPLTIGTGSSYSGNWSVSYVKDWTSVNEERYTYGCALSAAVVLNKNTTAGLVFSKNDCLTTQSMAWSKDGKYYGYRVANGVILAIVDGTLSADGMYAQTETSTAIKSSSLLTFSQNGVLSGGWNIPSSRAWSTGVPQATGYLVFQKGYRYQYSGSGKLVLSVDPDVEPGIVSIPQLTVIGQPSQSGQVISNPGVITIFKSVSCSITVPSVVDFGVFRLEGESEGTKLASVPTSLNVSCSNYTVPVSARLKLSGLTDGGSYGLALTSPDNAKFAPARVTAVMTATSGAPASGCMNSASTPGGVKMDGTPSNSSVLIPGTIPLRFDLCRFGQERIGHFGKYTGTATVTIDWD